MILNLTHIDSPFTNQYNSLWKTQHTIAKQLEHYPFDLTKDEITRAVETWPAASLHQNKSIPPPVQTWPAASLRQIHQIYHYGRKISK
jgi:hypothetical protein